MEAWRLRRTAYSSGRKEAIGFKAPDVGAPSRKVLNPPSSAIQHTALRGRFRSRQY